MAPYLDWLNHYIIRKRGEDFKKMKPFLKWAGGKYKIIDRVLDALPKGEQLIACYQSTEAS